MQGLFEDIKKTGVFDEFVARVLKGEDLLIEGLWDSVKGLLSTILVDQGERTALYIARSPREAEILYDEVTSFKKGTALLFPSWETLPHEKVAPHPEIVSDRFSVLKRLLDRGSSRKPFVVITNVQAVLQKIASPKKLSECLLTVASGEEVTMENLLKRLVSLSYEREEMVERKGCFSVRGGIVDVFPTTESWPARLEFFGDTVESVREFDPVTQRSTRKIEYVTILHANEMALNAENSNELSSVLDYFDKAATTIIYDDRSEIRKRVEELQPQIPAGARDFLSLEEFEKQAEGCHKVFFNDLPFGTAHSPGATRLTLEVKPVSSLGGVKLVEADSGEARVEVFEAIPGWLKDGRRVYFVCNKAGEEERLRSLLKEKGIGLTESMRFATGQLSSGFFLEQINTIVVPDNEIFHRYKIRRAPRKYTSAAPIRDFEELSRGDYVVHVDHGIGRFRGIVTLEDHDPNREYLAIEYADEGKLYVPIAQAHLVSKYVGPTKRPPKVDPLGGTRWARRKRRVEIAVEDYASELLELYAARHSADGTAFSPDTEWQREFEDAFIYEDTPDQVKALEELKRDMESPRPMDRLVCGDVGYGKTEVAIRAAFKAVMDGRQVAVLVPTTVLAQQHYHTFSERMADYPVRIEALSRFRKPSQQKKIVEDLKAGKVDIVIGTHRLIQNDVGFKNLGLVVVDEEQRFGVKHKERLKQLRRTVDVVTMSATPIPRTLYMSLVGARDMSNIDTPPLDRLPVKTLLVEFDAEMVRSAILRELNRDGQVYFLHNRVQTIDRMTEYVQKLVPEATTMAAHGQMDEEELETIMEYFINGSIDVLVCTTIIESGLDIPNANTIMIDRADRFGLADLYQLRGRVGRWKHQAYAYLMVPRSREILESARKRLKALLGAQGLGAGFQIAMKDLEMRGAGNILGTEQHGHIAAVGFTLYCQLLRRTIERLKGKQVPEEMEVSIKIDLDAYIPRHYVSDGKQRIDLYKRLAGALHEEEVRDMTEEMKDRFGPLPPEVLNLIEIASLKIWAKNEKINRVEISDGKIIAERQGRKLMVEGRFPRLKEPRGRTVTREIRRSLESVLRLAS
jgi:transcription-repair coupling factor (superfamily II helicase)